MQNSTLACSFTKIALVAVHHKLSMNSKAKTVGISSKDTLQPVFGAHMIAWSHQIRKILNKKKRKKSDQEKKHK